MMIGERGIYALDGRAPRLGADCFVAPGACVVGDVALGAESSVWFGAVLRGDVERLEIGARTNIQDGAVLHADPGAPLTIGREVTVGHKAMLHGCTIGDGALVGIGAVVLNGAVIGARSVVGACALVTEGRRFPERSLILGSPARVVRTLTDEELAALQESATHYVENARRYLAGLEVAGGRGPVA